MRRADAKISDLEEQKDKLSSRFESAQLTVYQKEVLSEIIQPHYSYQEIALLFSVNPKTIERECRRNNVTIHKIGRCVRIPATEIPKILIIVGQNKS